MLRSDARRWAILGAILLALLPLKVVTAPADGPYRLDASYYFQIARHVANGDGLLTSVSLYHQGLDPLPAQARIYPLWPFLLGVAGRFVGLAAAATFLPPLLYFISLVLLYELCWRLWRSMDPDALPLLPGPVPLDAGHLVVAAFATNPIFFMATTDPYTEALAFTLAFGALLAVDDAARKEQPITGFAAGLLAGLAFLARSQMLVIVAALLVVLTVASARSRATRKIAFAAVLGVAGAVVPWVVFLRTHPSQTTDVGRFVTWVSSPSLTEYLVDRLPGLWIAFDPKSAFSYFSAFGATVVVVPLALIYAAVRLARDTPPPRVAVRPQHVLAIVAVAAAILNHGILVHRHAQFFLPWLFGWRHGLPFVFAVAVAAVYLLTQPSGTIRLAVATLIALSIITGALEALANAKRRPAPIPESFVQWVDSQSPAPTILTVRAQHMGMMTRGRYHWMDCNEPPQQTERMLERLPIDFVVVYEGEWGCRYLSGLQRLLEVHRQFAPPEAPRVWVLRRRNGDVPSRGADGENEPSSTDPRPRP
ncbi:MAG TPA: hypothetical protein VM557_01895 [Thermoanaerobaculia bacterium]|nr:hypothetical protein [Thermoanaerobaculia bacterium]